MLGEEIGEGLVGQLLVPDRGVREARRAGASSSSISNERGLEIGPGPSRWADSALGFWKAIEEVFPGTKHQRCWVHKTANVLEQRRPHRSRSQP